MTTPTLKILSYNIHKGFSATNRRFVLELIKESIKPIGANIVFLQEVLGEHDGHAERWEDWPSQSQFEYLADEVWSHYAYGKNAVYSAGHHGNAILSEFPISRWSNEDISSNRLENRGLLHTVLEIPENNLLNTPASNLKNGQLHCFCAHLSLFEGGREKQIDLISKAILRETNGNEPFILAGDFNDWRKNASDTLTESLGASEVFLSQSGTHARTYPASFPILCLDRIYVKGMNIKNGKTLKGNPWSKLSDHLALYAEIEIQ